MKENNNQRQMRIWIFSVGTLITGLLILAIYKWVPPASFYQSSLNSDNSSQNSSIDQNDRNIAPAELTDNSSLTAGGLYSQYCAQCHGSDGQSKTRMSDMMSIRPTNLIEGPYRRIKNRESISQVILHGMGTMPGFHRELSEQQALSVAEYVLNFSVTKNLEGAEGEGP